MQTSSQIREAIGSIDNDLRLIHTRVAAARLAVEQLRKVAVVSLAFAKGGEDDSPGNNVCAIIAFAQSNAGRDLAAATAVLAVLEAAPAYIEARANLDPLHAELAAAVDRELAEAHAHRLAEVAVEDAEAAAREKLESKIATDPAVAKARAALAGIKRLGVPLEAELASDTLDLDRELAADFHRN